MELTEEGRMVRQIKADWATKCEFLGVINASFSSGIDITRDRRGALNDIRNRISQINGNAFVITDISSSKWGTAIQADAYKCP